MSSQDYFQGILNSYSAALPSKAAYLERIGLEGEDIPITKEGLDKLQWAHLQNIPFENIDIFDYDLNIDFGIVKAFEKIISGKRGGYCFELNSIYMKLLEELGFDVYPVGARIMLSGSHYTPAVSHRATIVTIAGSRYYSDVGFGLSSAPCASICIDVSDEQEVGGRIYTVTDLPHNNKLITQHNDDGQLTLFQFSTDPFALLDFLSCNMMMQQLGWRAKRIANLRTADGAISIDGDILRVTKGKERTESAIKSAGEAMNILTEQFGMTLTKPLREEATDDRFPF